MLDKPKCIVFDLDEIWKDIKWYEWHYKISNLGRIKSLKNWKEKILNWVKLKYWYSQISLCLEWVIIRNLAHRLVAQHFIPNPKNYPLVCHKKEDLDKNGLLYNREDNLFWGTVKDNAQDRNKKWRANNNFQKKHPHLWMKFWSHFNSKNVYQYTIDWLFIKEWWSTSEVEYSLWISQSNVSACCLWKRKKAGWFIFKYKPYEQS